MKRLMTLLVLAALLAVPVRAGYEAILDQGLNPNVIYEPGEFDTINTFSGDLMLNIPIGPTYKTNGSLRYSFGLRYTADFWAYLEHYAVNTVPAEFETRYWVRTAGSNLPALATLLVLPLDAPDSGGFAGTEAVPTGTAGIGWTLSLGSYGANFSGESYPNGSYTDETGASHLFVPTMHAPTGDYTGASYTNDGSYLRLRQVCPRPGVACDGDAIIRREVDFPDGTVKHFKCVPGSGCTGASGGTWNLEWTADPFGNVLKIERRVGSAKQDLPPQNGEWVWTFTEYTLSNSESPERASPYYQLGVDDGSLQLVRSHRVKFLLESPSTHFPWFQRQRVTEFALAGPDGNQSMVYTPEYGEQSILRTVVQPWTEEDLIYPYDQGADTITVPILEKIHLPAPHGYWRFEYYSGSRQDGGNIYYNYGTTSVSCAQNPDHASCYDTSRLAGRVRKVFTPTGGGYEYAYGLRLYPRRACPFSGPGATGGYGGGVMIGVKQKTRIKPNGTADGDAIWRYAGNGYFRGFIDNDNDGVDDGVTCRAPVEFLASTLEPNGRLTISFYNIELHNPLFGAPFSADLGRRDQVTRLDGSVSELRYLSQQVYEVDMVGEPGRPFREDLMHGVRRLFPAYQRSDPPTTARLLRSMYATYESSGKSCDEGIEGAGCRQLNLRRRSMHTRFHDDIVTMNGKPPFLETVYSDFDGLGHYRQVNEYGNFRAASKPNYGAADHDHRIQYTRFNGDVSYVQPAGDTGGPNPSGMPAPGESWFLNTYSRMSTLEAGKVASSCHVFDARRGYLRAERRMKAHGNSAITFGSVAGAFAPTGPDDFLKLYERTQESPVGVRIFEEHYGGDLGGLPTWAFQNGEYQVPLTDDGGASVPGDTDVDYTIAAVMRYGATTATEYYQCPFGPLVARTQSAEVDPASGLPLSVKNEAAISTSFDYDAMGRVSTVSPPGGRTAQSYTYQAASTAGVNRLTITRGADGPALTFDYDSWGRLLSEATIMPSGSTSTTEYAYTTMSDLLRKTLPKIGNNAAGTIEYTYDVHRRPIRVKNADDKISEVEYQGAREQTSTIHSVARIGSSVARRTEKFDSFGRLAEVSDGEAHAEHRFDVLSKLAEVMIEPVGGGVPQTRQFVYDGRGVLAKEIHPEMRQIGGGAQVEIRNDVDARGHVFRRRLEWASGGTAGLAKWTRRYGYDRAERLTGVFRPGQGAAFLSLKTFHYENNNAPVGRRNRLTKAVRTNYYDVPRSRSIQVEQLFAYDACSATVTNCTGDVTSVATSAAEPDAAGVMRSFFSGTTTVTYDALGQRQSVAYPNFSAGSGLLAPARTLWLNWSRGLVTSIKDGPTEATAQRRAALTYAASGIISGVTLSAPGVSDEITPDPRGLPRPVKFAWKWDGGSLETGTFSYDGAGSLAEVGAGTVGSAEIYKYDEARRLRRASIGNDIKDYSYDAYGNLTAIGARAIHVDVKSNRLTGRFVYDEAGHATTLADDRGNQSTRTAVVDYDPLDLVTRFEAEGIGRLFVYDASDERIGVIDYASPAGRELWSLRDGARVVRDFERTWQGTTPQWSWKADYVHRPGALTTIIRPGATGAAEARDVHVDHLGSTRVVTGPDGHPTAASGTSGYRYRPYGSLLFAKPMDERMAYTGHERDDDGSGATELDVDYMHARYYLAHVGRFLSIDPAFDVDPKVPQSWNQYAYVRSSPMNAVDPTGRAQKGGGMSLDDLLRRMRAAQERDGRGLGCLQPADSGATSVSPKPLFVMGDGAVIVKMKEAAPTEVTLNDLSLRETQIEWAGDQMTSMIGKVVRGEVSAIVDATPQTSTADLFKAGRLAYAAERLTASVLEHIRALGPKVSAATEVLGSGLMMLNFNAWATAMESKYPGGNWTSFPNFVHWYTTGQPGPDKAHCAGCA